MIALLLALHPKAWRVQYGEEFRDLLESNPVTTRVVIDVLRNAMAQQARAHGTALRLALAVVLSAAVEWVAVSGDFADNIVWAPNTGPRVLLLATLILPWTPLVIGLVGTARVRLRARDHV